MALPAVVNPAADARVTMTGAWGSFKSSFRKFKQDTLHFILAAIAIYLVIMLVRGGAASAQAKAEHAKVQAAIAGSLAPPPPTMAAAPAAAAADPTKVTIDAAMFQQLLAAARAGGGK